MNNSTLRTATMFIVAAILVAGTISMTAPASFAQAYYGQKEYKGYDDSYGKDYDKKKEYKGYDDSYGKDYDKKKASEVNIQKVKCNNIIVNGIDVPSSSPGGMFDGTTDENDGAWAEDQWVGDGHKGSIGIDKNIVNICINKNNEVVEVVQDGNGNGEVGCEECFDLLSDDDLQTVKDYLADNGFAARIGQNTETVNSIEQLCAFFTEFAQNKGNIQNNLARLFGPQNADIGANKAEPISDCIADVLGVPDETLENVGANAQQPVEQNSTQQNSAQLVAQQQDQNTEESNPQLAAIQKLQQLKTQKLSDMIE